MVFASSTACPVTDTPPTLTVSLYTSPLAPEPSPYEIFQLAPLSFLAVFDLDGL